MILERLTNPNPMPLCVAQDKIDVKVLRLPSDVVKLDFPSCRCPISIPVFADSTDSSSHLNDILPSLYRKVVSADTFVFSLEKDGVEVFDDNQIRNGDAGEFYDIGTWSTFSEQENYIGIIIHWRTVLSAHGPGEYVLKADKTILGIASQEVSATYKLMNFGPAALGTVRIDGIQSGRIDSADFDYTDLVTNGRSGWPQQIRIKGEFIPEDDSHEKDFILDGQRKKQQIQRSVVKNYTLNTKLIPSEISELIRYNYLLANQLTITDYNPNNNIGDFIEVPVEFEEPTDFIPSRQQKSIIHKWSFTGKKDIRKSNP